MKPFNESFPIQQKDAQIKKLWEELEDIPFSDVGLDEDWRIFKVGTPREEIWRWFDKHYSLGIVGLI